MTDLSIEALCSAVEEMEQGLIDANLGSGILKKRVALPGRGKRGSTRILVATNGVDRWFFIFGVEKSDRDNINAKELRALKALASDLLRLGVSELSAAVAANTLREICHEN
jgi:hypothetical protein